jgi:hypothetical protein
MKLFYLFTLSLFMSISAHAQQGWKLQLDTRVLLHATEENEEKNIVKLKLTDVKKAKQLLLHYNKAEENKDWVRTIALYDEGDKVLATMKGKKFFISTAVLQKHFKSAGTLKLFTTSIPKDPQLAARIRVRRVHLCTLVMN